MHDIVPTLAPHYGTLPEILPAEGKRRARVALFLGCAADAFFPQTNLATARVLQRNGCEVWVPRHQGCCGALHHHAGLEGPARKFAASNCAAFAKQLRDVDAIINNAGGCGPVLKEYGHLLEWTPVADQGAAFAKKVRDISELMRSSVPRTIELDLDLERGLPSIEADPSQIQQLVMNLNLNAVEATGERPGAVRVKTAVRLVGGGESLTHFRPDPPVPGAYIMIRVSDNGCGMADSVKAQIFDPFFTTKPQGKGTGLGLATVYGIVKQSGGNIWVYSELGQGSTFTIYLPRARGSGRTQPGTRPAPPAAGEVSILIVEDDPALRGLI